VFKKVVGMFGAEPYTTFTGLLLRVLKGSSKEAYLTLGRSYEQFLKADRIFAELYNSYGHKYFGIDKKKGGLLSLIE
jgi:hypothetical protein